MDGDLQMTKGDVLEEHLSELRMGIIPTQELHELMLRFEKFKARCMLNSCRVLQSQRDESCCSVQSRR